MNPGMEPRPFLPALPFLGPMFNFAVSFKTHRNAAFDAVAERRAFSLERFGGNIGFYGAHAAADVDTDGRRHDRRLRGNDRADRGPESPVHVRHDGDVPEDKRKGSEIFELLGGLFLNIFCPDFHRDFIFEHRLNHALLYIMRLGMELLFDLADGWCILSSLL